MDVLLDEGILKEIPIIGSIINTTQGILHVRDRLFLKKLLAFLLKSKDVNHKERARFVEKIENSKEYRVKVGESLLNHIDKCNDWEESELLAVFFNACVQGQISYKDFLKSAKIIEALTIEDLKDFQKKVTQNKEQDFDENDDVVGELLYSGLFTFYIEEVRIEDEDDWKVAINNKYKVNGGNQIIQVSPIGKKMYKILKAFYK